MINHNQKRLKDKIIQSIVTISEEELGFARAQNLRMITAKVLSDHKNHSIITWCFNINQCLQKRWRLSGPVLIKLTIAHTIGWIGYTLADDTYDSRLGRLPNKELVIWSIRKSKEIFESVYKPTVEMFDIMDKSLVCAHTLPYSLWRKSAGVLCVPLAMLQLNSKSNSGGDFIELVKKYLVKKQLCDDYIDRNIDLFNWTPTSFTIQMREPIIGGNERFLRHYSHAYSLAIQKTIENLLSKMERDSNRGRSVWTRSGIRMFAKLIST